MPDSFHHFLKVAILKNKKTIQVVLAREKVKRGVTTIRDLLPKSPDQEGILKYTNTMLQDITQCYSS